MVYSTWIILFGLLAADEPAAVTVSSKAAPADVAPRGAGLSRSKRPATQADPSDRRDVLLLLEGGPLHLRLHLALGGVSLAEARRQYVGKLVDSLDTDFDGKLSREEAARSPLLRTKNRPGAAQFLEGLRGQGLLSRRDVERTIDRLGGEPVA